MTSPREPESKLLELAASMPGLPKRSPIREVCTDWLEFGLLAPTTHNTVPQRFAWREKGARLTLLVDRAFVLPESDPCGRQATVSVGCALSQLILAALATGKRCKPEPLSVPGSATTPGPSEADRYTALADLLLEPGSPKPGGEQLLTAMHCRKIVRAEYDPSIELPKPLAEEMSSIVSTLPGLELHLITDRASLSVMGKFQELADTTVMNRSAFAQELADWFLPNEATTPLGMRGREFGLTDQAARHFHLGLRGAERLLPDEVAGLAKSASLGMRSSSAVAVITTADDEVPSRLAAGRAYACLANLLTLFGYVTHMHAAMTEVTAANLGLRGRLRTTARPMVVFRLGKPLRAADGERPPSVRPALRELMLQNVAVAPDQAQ